MSTASHAQYSTGSNGTWRYLSPPRLALCGLHLVPEGSVRSCSFSTPRCVSFSRGKEEMETLPFCRAVYKIQNNSYLWESGFPGTVLPSTWSHLSLYTWSTMAEGFSLGLQCHLAEQTPTWGGGPDFLHHSCTQGAVGGAGPPREGFLYETVSQCWVFGGGTQLTVLGESPLPPPCLFSQSFG